MIFRRLARCALCAALACTLFSLSSGHARAAGDAIAADAYARVNESLLTRHVLPRYEQLAGAMAGLADAAEQSCAGSTVEDIDTLRDRYHAAMDAWMGVQHLRFGPVELFMRSYRLYFWPEARGKVADAVEELLSKGDVPGGEGLSEASVAVQGLPAVEYLLYDDAGPGGDASRCALLAAVARNMQTMASGILSDWRGGDVHFRQSFLQPGPGNAFYQAHADATLDLFKSFHGGLQRIADVKLKPAVGDGIGSARPGMVESRRSQRAMRNIVANLEALQALYLGEGGPGLSDLVVGHGGDHELDPLMRRAFRLTLETARSIDAPLTRAVTDEAGRPRVEKLLTRVLALKQIVKSRVAATLGLAVGFNALDGD